MDKKYKKENKNDKDNIKRIPAYQLFEIAEESLNNGMTVRITVAGNSMYPFLRNITDSVELYKESYENIKISDIVVAKNKNGNRYTLHRVYKKNGDNFYMLGDGNFSPDGPYNKSDFICKVRGIYRKEKYIPCSSLRFRILSKLWLFLKPFRKTIFNVYFKIRRKK